MSWADERAHRYPERRQPFVLTTHKPLGYVLLAKQETSTWSLMIAIDRFQSQHHVVTDMPNGERAWVLTGVALLHPDLKGAGSGWRRETVQLGIVYPRLPADKAVTLSQWAPYVSLSAIANDNVANNAGWAVDDFQLHQPTEPQTVVLVRSTVAVRDVDGWVFRLGYCIHLIGSLVDLPAPD